MELVALDYDEKSIEACKRYIQFNGALRHRQRWKLFLLMPKFICLPIQKNLMRLTLILVDRSPSAFLDSAVQSIADGGLLMCTATDLSCHSNSHTYISVLVVIHFINKALGGLLLRTTQTNIHQLPCYKMLKAAKDKYPAYKKIVAALVAISEELPDAKPLFVNLHSTVVTLKWTPPSALFYDGCALLVIIFLDPLWLKTDAPRHVNCGTYWAAGLRIILRVKTQPKSESGIVILSKEPVLQLKYSASDW
ncbi:hypothetical protein OPV22_016294 [Ensete ventricosum]|uniref:tRNA (guanine(26)-N(2))-dimethyltransferase n=1 Tax=Ensete ventricosum TaxID=4639 RepID=A0AAV8QZF4_ENSVE|nr:hypothetical protein OPV22_016294 [Ensete ventricosum]